MFFYTRTYCREKYCDVYQHHNIEYCRKSLPVNERKEMVVFPHVLLLLRSFVENVCGFGCCGLFVFVSLLNERKEGNVLFNDTLNTFYLWRRTYSKGSSPNGLLFPISSKGYFYIHHPTNRIVYTMGFITQVLDHWLEREKRAELVHHEGSIRRPTVP